MDNKKFEEFDFGTLSAE